MNIEEIKKRSANFKEEYLPFFNNNGEMYEWNAMYEDNLHLLSIIKQQDDIISEALKHSKGAPYDSLFENKDRLLEVRAILQKAIRE